MSARAWRRRRCAVWLTNPVERRRRLRLATARRRRDRHRAQLALYRWPAVDSYNWGDAPEPDPALRPYLWDLYMRLIASDPVSLAEHRMRRSETYVEVRNRVDAGLMVGIWQDRNQLPSPPPAEVSRVQWADPLLRQWWPGPYEADPGYRWGRVHPDNQETDRG